MLQTAILESLERLPDSLQREVLHFIEFLLVRYAKPEEEAAKPAQKKRQAGALKGRIIMADDFDAPLADMQDYM